MTLELQAEAQGINTLVLRLQSLQNNLVTKAILERIGNRAKLFIVSRTLRGVDVDENPFKPYSERYRRFRQNPKIRGKKYENISARPVSKVDLFFTGRMQGALTHAIEDNETVRLFFDDAGDPDNKPSLRAHGHHFGSKILPQRKFFSLNEKELDAIAKEIEEDIDELIKEGA